jgi:glycine/D-amino acid oxidase-like deaminating enzyme/nitrite reductase/ring-hydroxylating ferredoxin subunit
MPNYKTALWAEQEPAAPRRPLEGDLEVDVAVIGAGITGLTTAYLLKQAGLRVAVLESRRVGSGETKRTTAHLTEVLDLRFKRLISRFGEKGAKLAVEGQRAAIARISTLADELGVDCQLEQVDGYLIAETPSEGEDLEDEAGAARELGLSPVLGEAPLPYRGARALRFEKQAQFHPRAYLDRLADRIDGGGCQIFEITSASDVTDGDPCRVLTDRGTVTARDVVVASGVPISNRVFVHLKLGAYRSYVVAVRCAAPLAPGLFWDMKDPYHYVRSHVVDGTPYLIVGGEDHKVGEDDDTTAPFARLESYVAERFGLATAPTDYRWSGQIIESADGLPYVGRNTASRHVFVATGYGGNGITGGTWAGTVLADQIRHIENPWSALLDATRIKPLAAAGAVLSENLAFPKHLIADRLLPLGRKGGLDHIAAGEGAVVSVQGVKLAVYRNAEGHLSSLSPICPHLGCFVHWNSAEKSWDCPCHGSRFDSGGRVLNGPATSPLESKTIPPEPDR